MDQYVVFGQLNQAVNWTPLFQAVSWKTHDQAVKSGPSNSAVNWDRQDQQQISGKIQPDSGKRFIKIYTLEPKLFLGTFPMKNSNKR